jgi:hypothetical protein
MMSVRSDTKNNVTSELMPTKQMAVSNASRRATERECSVIKASSPGAAQPLGGYKPMLHLKIDSKLDAPQSDAIRKALRAIASDWVLA